MDARDRIDRSFAQSIGAKQETLEQAGDAIVRAAGLLSDSLMAGGKVLVCGNGGSAADAQHLASELVNRFELDRRPLPAIALTTDTSALTSIANDYSFDDIFTRQLAALGRRNDVLVAISTSGNSGNILGAVRAAHAQGMRIIALSGREGGDLARILGPDDVEVRVPAASTARIQEIHILIIHCWCDLIDHHFLEQEA